MADREGRGRPLPNLNKIGRHKGKEEAEFRVHFYLMNVFWKGPQTIQKFLESTASRIAKFVKVSIIQIVTVLDESRVDLTVGLESDADALAFLMVPKKILLPIENGELIEFQPIVAEVFKSYIEKQRNALHESKRKSSQSSEGRKALNKLNSLSSPSDKEDERVRGSQSERSRSRSRSRSSERKKHIDRRGEESNKDVKNTHMWIFCIPLEYKSKEICQLLEEKDLKVKNCDWRMWEDMQYLEVELAEGLAEQQMHQLDFHMQFHPLLTLPKKRSDLAYVSQQLLARQVEINFEKDIDEVEFIRYADKFKGVVAIVKDQFYGPRKYVVAFNLAAKARNFGIEAEKHYKNSKVGKPKYPIRLGRLEKQFSFHQIVANLALEAIEDGQEEPSYY